MAVGDRHGRLEVGVGGHQHLAVLMGAFQQHPAEFGQLLRQPPVRFAQRQLETGDAEVVAGAAGLQDTSRLVAEDVDQMGLVGQVEAARGGHGLQCPVVLLAEFGDGREQGGGGLGCDDPALGEHHDMGEVDMGDPVELGLPGGPWWFPPLQEHAADLGGRGAAQAA